MTDLGTLGGNSSTGNDINDSGQVAGYSNGHAFITGPNGVGMIDLGTLGGDNSMSYAKGINGAGRVVGYSASYLELGGMTFHAFITGPNGVGMTDLGTLGGDNSDAFDINDTGQVVGLAGTAEGAIHAFITGPDGVGMTDLGTLGGGGSEASGINDAGQVVGGSATAEGQSHAFITGPNGVGMTDLNSLAGLPSGIILTSAIDINNAGQVLVAATIPEPQSYALMLAGLILIGFMVRRKRLLP
jgi:probable HAF family extracellular repeat protein